MLEALISLLGHQPLPVVYANSLGGPPVPSPSGPTAHVKAHGRFRDLRRLQSPPIRPGQSSGRPLRYAVRPVRTRRRTDWTLGFTGYRRGIWTDHTNSDSGCGTTGRLQRIASTTFYASITRMFEYRNL